MDSIKAQDIIRHIFKDEDKGVEYVTGLSITDGVEVLTKVLPELIKKAQLFLLLLKSLGILTIIWYVRYYVRG